MRNSKYFLADAAKHEARVHQLDFIGTNNKLNLRVNQYNRATDGRSAYFAIESFMIGKDHNSSLISAAEQGLRDTTYTTNVNNWKIEDYVSKHMEFHSTLND